MAEHSAAGKQAFLDDLGVRAEDTSQVEHKVLQKAERQAQDTAELPPSQDGAAKQRKIQKRLQTIRREERAIKAALESLDHRDDSEAEAGEPGGSAAAKPGVDAQQEEQQQQLQRATLTSRLQGLQAKREQLKSAFLKLEQAAEREAGQPPPAGDGAAASGASQPEETQRDRLVRLGMITPFHKLDGFDRSIQGGQPTRQPRQQLQQQPGASQAAAEAANQEDAAHADATFSRLAEDLKQINKNKHRSALLEPEDLPKREKAVRKVDELFWRSAASGNAKPAAGAQRQRKRTLAKAKASINMPRPSKRRRLRKADTAQAGTQSDESEFASSGEEPCADMSDVSGDSDETDADLMGDEDDADDDQFEQRLKRHRRKQQLLEQEQQEDVVYDGGFRIPGDLHDRLLDFQKTGVKWLWELHMQRAGGIVGDEMGLGKTIQLAVFLAGLHHSRMFKPTLIVCPATVLRQWLRELRTWYPLFRVAILHDSATGNLPSRPSRSELVQRIVSSPTGILVTSFDQMRLQRDLLLDVPWGYAVLDEGHKIRNPDAEVTLVAKQLQTVHRLILSGSPIQNRLTELWSLFDYVFPGKLGTLPVFQAQFAIPIQIGGYSNASRIQVSTAYKCAVVLRDLISPYLLRRRKADVALQLPKKTEQVLFCKLCTEQRELYRAYISSKEVDDIFNGSRNALAGIDVLRKICNHPDLLQRTNWSGASQYGALERSGKLTVTLKVLEAWQGQGHRALVFTQTQQMLDILERAAEAAGLRYHRMDGTTPVSLRSRLVDDFNNNQAMDVFLLTTKVGGLGINLTGADRVLLYDPDWNPSTDMQARERAWRIGQKKEVTVYRLITSGTIEEKVYHRQIYKQFLTNKVLQDPKQKRFFKSKDMQDLFTLGDEYSQETETAAIFSTLTSADVRPEDDRPSTPQPDESALSSEVTGLSGAEDGSRTPLSGAAAGAEGGTPASAGDDAKILRDLFEGTGVMSALDHTKIEGANDPQAVAAEAEAAQVARRAAEALRRSRQACQNSDVSIPTWTGRSGEAGVSARSRRRFGAVTNPALAQAAATAEGGHTGQGSRPVSPSPSSEALGGFGSGTGAIGIRGGSAPSSAVLLARMRARNQAADSSVAASLPGAAELGPEAEALQLSTRIVDYLAEHGGRASSSSVVQHFGNDVGPSQAALFRQLLQQVAKLQTSPANGKVWVLKSEFTSSS
ncbi:hypothetical protein WJX74_000576 [Apatococcus lobatus]|uniref:Uncharacterized protein n=1 Tax=Apatococcus lobatus TaxID=904363 RepID=A0AAW1RUZ8_9CHLO